VIHVSDVSDDHTPFRDAEAWLAAQGVERDPLRVAPPPTPEDGRPDVSAREAARLATEAPAPPPTAEPEPAVDGPGGQPDLQDQVARAVAYARRATAQAPASEQRLRDKLAARDHPAVVIRLALERCRDEGIVDDEAYARAFAEERRSKGHAPFRIRVDLGKRGFPDELVDRVLARFEAEDPEAQALELATRKARSLQHVEAETAFRRTVGYVARRGYTEGIARKVAREAVFTARDDERTAGH
jgi:regulatory protein